MEENLSFEDKVKEVLETVRPSLQADGGDIEFVSADEQTGQVSVKLTGACGGCPMATYTLKQGVEAMMKSQIPEVTEIVQVN